MTAGEILLPLIEKAMQTKGYTRDESARRAFKWLAAELDVPVEALVTLDWQQEWCAQAHVEKALVPPPTKRKVRFEKPTLQPRKDHEPWKPEQWLVLQQIWGTVFYAAFFDEAVNGMNLIEVA